MTIIYNKYISLALFFLLTLFALLQWNDPDSLLWMALYLYSAINSLMAFYKKYLPLLLIIGSIGYLSGGIYLYQGDIWKWLIEESEFTGMKTTFIEKSREASGLFICFVVMIFHLYIYHKSKKNQLNS